MPSLAEITVADELTHVRTVAEARDWYLNEMDSLHFLIGLPSADSRRFFLWVECENYPVVPPAWHWCDEKSENKDHPADTPRGSGFLHPSGVICAPWNRLAYRSVDPRGPHANWTIGDWRNNPENHNCRTLGAMALRLYVELNSPRFAKHTLAA